MKRATSKPIVAARAALMSAQAAYNLAIRRSILRCKHTDIRECDYQPYEYLDTDPPRRVCMCCGLSEIGWGGGHVFLKGEAAKIDREDLMTIRTFTVDQDLKSAVRRGEIGLATALQKALP